MKKLSLVAMLPLITLVQSAGAETSMAVLEKRCSEQERQIHQLEEENSQLRSMLETATRTATSKPVKTTEPAVEKSPVPVKPTYYTVAQGDTLSRIARRHKTTPEHLAKINDIKDAGLIRPGQKLRLPDAVVAPAATAVPAPSPEKKLASTPESRAGTHQVKDGETFFGIARKYGLSVETLAEANPNVNPRSIRVGQNLQLVSRESEKPVAESTPIFKSEPDAAGADQMSSKPVSNKPLIRSIRIDEEITFGSFAAAHGMEPAKLNALNGLHLEPNTVLAKGSELYVSAQP